MKTSNIAFKDVLLQNFCEFFVCLILFQDDATIYQKAGVPIFVEHCGK